MDMKQYHSLKVDKKRAGFISSSTEKWTHADYHNIINMYFVYTGKKLNKIDNSNHISNTRNFENSSKCVSVHKS